MDVKLDLIWILMIALCKLSRAQLIDIYSNCDTKTSRCFGMPSNCISNKNCEVLMSATPVEGRGANFKLYWNRDHSGRDRWVGAALSRDREMGDDSVTECILWKNNSLTVRQGFTYCDDDSNDDDCGVRTVEPINGITDETGGYSDGWVYCSWSRNMHTIVRNFDFDIYKNAFHVMLVYGPIRGAKIHHHSRATVTKEAEYLGRPVSTEELQLISSLDKYLYKTEPEFNSNDKFVEIISLNSYQIIKSYINRTGLYYRKTIEEIRFSD